jgi:hypothetical protein
MVKTVKIKETSLMLKTISAVMMTISPDRVKIKRTLMEKKAIKKKLSRLLSHQSPRNTFTYHLLRKTSK